MGRAGEVHGVELEEEAARALAAAVGSNLGVLSQEMEKLATLVGDRRVVTSADVEAAGIQLPREDRWHWLDRVGERRFHDALAGLGTLFSQGESGVYLVAGLATHLLRLAVAVHGGRNALERALPPRQGWLSNRLLPQARGWPPGELEEALLDLRRVDRLLKSTGLSQQGLLEGWLLERMAAARS
jgi:DNA polymerase III delta subunit